MLRFFEPASQDYYNNLARTMGGPNSRTELHNFDDHNQDKVLGIKRDYKYFNRFCYESSLNQIPGEESLTARSTYSRIFGFAQLDTRMKIQSNNSLVRHQTINEETVTGRKCKRLKGELYNNVKLQNIPFSIPPTEKKLGDETAKKVKKSQKLGDKITALQQLVSPYGKTDTASVLQEASVYIKTLHDQIRELSLYHFGANPSLQGKGGGMISLDRRRLCLVPASSILTHSTNQQPVVNSSSTNI